MTDSSPSNTDLTKEQLQLMDDARASMEAIVCDPVAIAMQKRITELEQDAARYESGREVLNLLIDTQKDKIKQLEDIQRLNVETVARLQQERDALERKLPKVQRCAATMGFDPPQDCDAPYCGCNPEWPKVIEMLRESGWKSPQELRASAPPDESRLAIEELKNLINARRHDRDDFANDSEFADWALSRCRYTLALIEQSRVSPTKAEPPKECPSMQAIGNHLWGQIEYEGCLLCKVSRQPPTKSKPPVVTPPAEATQKYLESMAALMRDSKRLKDYFDHANCITHPSLYYGSAEPFVAWCRDIDEFMGDRAAVTKPSSLSAADDTKYFSRTEVWPTVSASFDANGSPVEPPDCPHCDGFLLEGTVLHGPRCPAVETNEPLCSCPIDECLEQAGKRCKDDK